MLMFENIEFFLYNLKILLIEVLGSTPSSYNGAEETALVATMWHNTGEASLYQEEMQMMDIKASCTG